MLILRLRPGLLRLGKDIHGPSKDGVMCDESCHCKVKARATCQEEWFYVGEGPHGGVLYRKTCSALDIDTWEVLTNFNCGNKEYF